MLCSFPCVLACSCVHAPKHTPVLVDVNGTTLPSTAAAAAAAHHTLTHTDTLWHEPHVLEDVDRPDSPHSQQHGKLGPLRRPGDLHTAAAGCCQNPGQAGRHRAGFRHCLAGPGGRVQGFAAGDCRLPGHGGCKVPQVCETRTGLMSAHTRPCCAPSSGCPGLGSDKQEHVATPCLEQVLPQCFGMTSTFPCASFLGTNCTAATLLTTHWTWERLSGCPTGSWELSSLLLVVLPGHGTSMLCRWRAWASCGQAATLNSRCAGGWGSGSLGQASACRWAGSGSDGLLHTASNAGSAVGAASKGGDSLSWRERQRQSVQCVVGRESDAMPSSRRCVDTLLTAENQVIQARKWPEQHGVCMCVCVCFDT